MNSAIDIKILLLIGFPIQKSPDLSLFSDSPKLIAANHVFHRLLAPRHPPCALCSLTINQITQHLILNLYYPIQLSKNMWKSKSETKNQRQFNPLFQTSKSSGGGKRARTADPLRARQVLSQLSYTPTIQDTSWTDNCREYRCKNNLVLVGYFAISVSTSTNCSK